MKKVAILGATKGMGRSLARQLAAQGAELFLLGRDADELGRSARDLEARAGRAAGTIGVAPCDLERPEQFGAALQAAEAGLGGRHGVVGTAGALPPPQQPRG